MNRQQAQRRAVTALTESLPFDQRPGAQGLADVAMSVLGAAAAFSSGFVKEVAGGHEARIAV